MKQSTLLVFAAVIGSTAHMQAQGLLQAIVTPEKAVAVVNQTAEGTWLSEIRPAALPAGAPPILNLTTLSPNGTFVASGSDGTQGVNHGVWVRVGDRRFLMTVFSFSYDANRVLTTITKVRINLLVSLDGQTSKGTSEVVVMDRTGKVLATIPGSAVSGVRLSPEIPADFYDFQKVQ
jgi:hypothetical protein